MGHADALNYAMLADPTVAASLEFVSSCAASMALALSAHTPRVHLVSIVSGRLALRTS